MTARPSWNRRDICEAYFLYAATWINGSGSWKSAILRRLGRISFCPLPTLSRWTLIPNGRGILAKLIRKSRAMRPTPVAAQDPPETCPRCGEDRLVDEVVTGRNRYRFCGMCSYDWVSGSGWEVQKTEVSAKLNGARPSELTSRSRRLLVVNDPGSNRITSVRPLR